MTAVTELRTRAEREHEAAVGQHVGRMAAVLTGRLRPLSVEMRDLLARKIPELDGEPMLLELMLASIEGNVVTILQSLRHDIDVDHQEPPTAAVEYARRLAQRGLPVSSLVRAYRLGQQFLLRAAFEASAGVGGTAETVRMDAYHRVVQQVFDYIDWISQRVVVVYEEERESWLANQTNARDAMVRQLLSGADVDVIAAESATGYRLASRHHVAVVAWLPDAASRTELSRSVRAVRELAEVTGAGAPLVVGCDRATAWGWLPVPGDWAFDESWASWRPSGTPAPVLALGSSKPGIAGFVRSHEEALRVHRLVSLGGVPDRALVSHDEPGLAATTLLAADLPQARAWIHDVLGELMAEGESTSRLRTTLLTLLQHDMSYTATAEAMVMHKNSIRYRLTSAEEMLGYRVTENRLDVEVALTACKWLGRAVLEDDVPG